MLGKTNACTGGSSPVVGETITVINKTGRSIYKGDKVWINKSPEYSYDYYLVGNVKVDDGTKVASGFSSGNARNAIKVTKLIDFSNPWEMNFKITTGNNVTSRQKLNGSLDEADYSFPTIEISRSGYPQLFMLCMSSTGSSWDISSDTAGTYQIQPNTTYWVRFGWTGSTYYLDYSLNGKDYIRDITVNSSLPVYNSNKYMGIGNDLYTRYEQVPFLGEIDLLETYIKINNNVWWRAVTTLPKEYHIVDYRETTSSSLIGKAMENIAVGTKVANVENGGIENNGIMSTYVADKTRTEQITVYKNKKFEGVFKVKASEWSSNDNHFIKSMEDFFYVRGGGDSLWSVLYTTVSNYYQKPFSSLDWIYIKIEHSEHWLAWSYSFDGENYELMYHQSGSITFVDGVSTFAFNLYFGCKGSNTYPTWNGQIDFNECYFKVDDRLVWSGVKYINGGSGLVNITNLNDNPNKRLGITLDDMFGTIDDNKVLQAPPMENLTVDLTGIKDIGESALESRFYRNSLVYKVIAPDLERVSGKWALGAMCTDGGQYIEEVSCPKLSVVSGDYAFASAFDGCLVLNVDFGNLREVSGNNAFSGTFIDNNELYECNIFDNIETISGNHAFRNCFKNVNGLWESTGELNINATSITGSDALYDAFRGIENVYVVNFPNLTTVTTNALRNACPSVYEIHFRADMQPVISKLAGYAEKFGADEATIYFDL